MADADSDVDMSPPTTPTRTSSTFPLITSTPWQRSKTLRLANIVAAQDARYTRKETPYSPGDLFTAFDRIPSTKPKENISKATEKAFDKARDNLTEREQIAVECSKALDEATFCVDELGLGHASGRLERALSQVIKLFALGEDLLNKAYIQNGLSQSLYAPHQRDTSITKPSYAEEKKTSLPNVSEANLPQKPGKTTHQQAVRKPDNRIFVRLPVVHQSRVS